mgnify:CR=1 FL=1
MSKHTVDMEDVDFQKQLMIKGYVVVPTPLVDNLLRQKEERGFYTHLMESPEFLHPDPQNPTWKPQLGGFAVMGNPSSFHHPW